MAIFDIRNLNVEIDTPQGRFIAIEKFNLTVQEGEICGLVGASGSGKTLVARAIVNLVGASLHMSAERMRMNAIDLLSLSHRRRRQVIAEDIAMIFQDAASCLNPSETIGQQLLDTIPLVGFKGRWWQRYEWRKQRAVSLLHKVGIRDHEWIIDRYPHELTNGECQKIMIAMAIATKPKILIADEPTKGLDARTQSQILRLLTRMNQVEKTTIILISHDFNMVTQWADWISVMYCGQMVESAATKDILEKPKHPYTEALLQALDNFNGEIPHKSKLKTLPGAIPALQHLPAGCRLGPRCPYARKQCVKVPALRSVKKHRYSCHFPLNSEKKT